MRALGQRLVIVTLTILMLQYSLVCAANAPAPQVRKLSVKENIQNNLPATVTIYMAGEEGGGQGSGVVVRSDGLIITCFHVIDDIREGVVHFPDGKTYPIAEVLAVDPVNDIALIRVNGSGFKPVRLQKTNKIEIGDEIVAIGSPRGEETTVSTGIISSVRKESNKLQFTAPISNGSSGGPLFNNYGELIGIAAASKVNAQNLNFAIPSSEIELLLTPSNTSVIQPQAPLKVSFDQALSRYLVSHNDEQARMAAAEYYIKRGNADKVLELTSNQAPSNEINYLRANAYFLKNDATSADELFNQLPEQYFKNEPKLYLYQAGLALKQHDLQKAKLALERYNIHSDEKDALYFYTVGDLSIAFAFTESRQLDQDQYYEKAIGFYEIAAEKDTRFVSAIYKKGLIQLTMGDLNSANETYKELQSKDPKLAQALEGRIVNVVNAYASAKANYYRELSKEQLIDNLTLLLYSIAAIISEGGYYYRP